MMKCLKFLALILILALLPILITACTSAEEEPLSSAGEPELLWSVTHVNRVEIELDDID